MTSDTSIILNPDTGIRETLNSVLKGKDKQTWTQSLENEWDRLCDGKLGNVKGTNTIVFVHNKDVPIERKVTYGNFRLDHRPLKPEPMRVRLTAGGDKLDYPFDATTPASSLLE